MKKQLVSLLLVTFLVLICNVSCVKKEYIDENEITPPVQIIGTPLNDGLISIKASTSDSNLKSATISANDTIYAEKNQRVIYKAISDPSITIVNYFWTFAENNAKASTQTVEFWHGLDPGAKTSVTVVGVEANGTAHTATAPVKMVNSLDGLPGFFVVSKTAIAGGMYNCIFAAHKKGMVGVKGKYGYIGTITSPPWTVKEVAPADTNFNYVAGSLVAANSGDIGKYVVVRVTLASADHEIHVGHIGSDGNLIWGTFWTFPKNGKFNLAPNGDITPLTAVGLPGTNGDIGINAVIRMDILANSVIVYTKHTTTFTKGFVQLQRSDGVWLVITLETAVSGYPNWGKIEIPYSQFPTPQLLVFRFGPNADVSYVYSTNMPGSAYYDANIQALALKIVPLKN